MLNIMKNLQFRNLRKRYGDVNSHDSPITNDARLAMYTKILELAVRFKKVRYDFTLCFLLDFRDGELSELYNYPEIMFQKPSPHNNNRGLWFPRDQKSTEKRIQIIRNAIKLLQ